MQLCKKNVYDLWRESEILLIFAYTTSFNHFSNYIAIAHY